MYILALAWPIAAELIRANQRPFLRAPEATDAGLKHAAKTATQLPSHLAGPRWPASPVSVQSKCKAYYHMAMCWAISPGGGETGAAHEIGGGGRLVSGTRRHPGPKGADCRMKQVSSHAHAHGPELLSVPPVLPTKHGLPLRLHLSLHRSNHAPTRFNASLNITRASRSRRFK